MNRVPQRDVLEVDVLIVGAGPAGLSAAIRLAQLQRERANGRRLLTIAVLEKARAAGAHSLSGAVLDPSALAELIPDYRERGAPLETPVTRDEVMVLGRTRSYTLPFTPPPLDNSGCFVVALSSLVAWMATQAEMAGVEVVTGFGAAELLFDGERVAGVRTADRGRSRQGAPLPGFEPGADVRARLTILCDGVRGNLTKQLVARFGLDRDRLPQTYALGLKELWDVPPGRVTPGRVIHTIGFPLGSREFGGAFLYGLDERRLALGLVAGLDYEDPAFDLHDRLQALKTHPFISRLLDGGARVRYGAKALPEGGWHAIPRPYSEGVLIAGDAAGLVNALRLKGIHLAMRSGMLAAETAFEALEAGDVSQNRLSDFERAIAASSIRDELYPVRNVRQAFSYGRAAGLLFSAASIATGGWWFRDRLETRAGHERMHTLRQHRDGGRIRPGGGDATSPAARHPLSSDKLTSVHASGTRHREDAPTHLLVRDTTLCHTRCREEYGNPCTRVCPAGVYEMVPDSSTGVRLHINASNCLHCKACDIVDPYQVIDWTAPEGGDGPSYEGM